MMENTDLHNFHAGIIIQLDGAPPHFTRRVCAFMDREIHDR
jgi:hypothetical protein